MKSDLISEAVETIPQWLAFLNGKEAEFRAMLDKVQVEDAATKPLMWLDTAVLPPTDEAQAPVVPLIQGAGATVVHGEQPPWQEQEEEA